MARSRPSREPRESEIIEALSDSQCRTIIINTIARPLSVEDIAKTLGIPSSSCYRKMRKLCSTGILKKTEIPNSKVKNGVKTFAYRSNFKSGTISFGDAKFKIRVKKNTIAREI